MNNISVERGGFTENAHPHGRGEGHKEETCCRHDGTEQHSETRKTGIRQEIHNGAQYPYTTKTLQNHVEYYFCTALYTRHIKY